jgi:ABC-type transport system involved in cytochrome bd biosynthesis fused ATPase/permease subunit
MEFAHVSVLALFCVSYLFSTIASLIIMFQITLINFEPNTIIVYSMWNIFLQLAFVGIGATPSGEDYWQSVWPNTPLPKAFYDLLLPC